MDKKLITDLERIVGKGNVLTAPEDLLSYSFDAFFLAGEKNVPETVVRPGSMDEVSRILALARGAGVPVVPRGAGSNICGGVIPVKGGIVLSMDRMNRILDIDRENLTADVEPGVITGRFQREVEKLGLFYPPDPASLNFSTMGGNVAEGAGGPRGMKYGVTKDYVLGLEVALSDGRIIRTGARTMKSVAGYDMTRLFVGSEGTLGVIGRITVKLLPLPPSKKTILAIFDSVDDAAEAVASIVREKITPTTLEIMDNTCIRAVEEYTGAGLPTDAQAILLIEVDGEEEAVWAQISRVEEQCRRCRSTRSKIAADQAEADRFWQARRSVFPAMTRVRPTNIVEDATIPRNRLPEMIRRIQEMARKYDVLFAVLAHAGDGNMHASIHTDERDAEEMKRVYQAVDELFRTALELGGSVTGEHGIGIAKRDFLRLEVGDDGLDAMRRIKQALDPTGIMNPGIMFKE